MCRCAELAEHQWKSLICDIYTFVCLISISASAYIQRAALHACHHIAAMFSGWEEVEEGEVADWEVQRKRRSPPSQSKAAALRVTDCGFALI